VVTENFLNVEPSSSLPAWRFLRSTAGFLHTASGFYCVVFLCKPGITHEDVGLLLISAVLRDADNVFYKINPLETGINLSYSLYEDSVRDLEHCASIRKTDG
jgi:hypothetical protein